MNWDPSVREGFLSRVSTPANSRNVRPSLAYLYKAWITRRLFSSPCELILRSFFAISVAKMRSTWITLLVPFLGSCAFAEDVGERVGWAAMTTPSDGNLEIRQLSCPAGNTACADGDGCCPVGAACTRSKGQGLCATGCDGGPTCTNGPVKACCPLGLYCNPTGTLCLTNSPFAVPSITVPSITVPSF